MPLSPDLKIENSKLKIENFPIFSLQGKKKAHDSSWAGKNESYNSLTKTYTL